MKRLLAAVVVTSMLFIAVAVAAKPPAPEPAQQYPVMEGIAEESNPEVPGILLPSSCGPKRGRPRPREQLQKQENATQMLRQDPAMRKAFLDIVAAPIANKMFECGMIP